MKFGFYLLIILFFSLNSLAQEGKSPLDTSANSSNFNSYIRFHTKIVDFENSLYVNDFKTTEFQIENGFTYNLYKFIDFSFGINGGLILGIPYEDRLQAYFNSGNISGIDIFLQYYGEIDYVDQTLAKTRLYIGLHPQIGFNITEKWKVHVGTEIRYYFQPFFEERSCFGNTLKEDGVNYMLLGNLGVDYLLTDHFSLGINYDRGLSYLHRVQRGDPGGSGLFESSVRYHSLGLNVSYSF